MDVNAQPHLSPSATLPLARKFPQLTKEDASLASETVWSFGEKEKYVAADGNEPRIVICSFLGNSAASDF